MAVKDYRIVFLAAVCLSVGVTDATSAGALLSACQDMTPGHYPVATGIGESPYGIEASQDTYMKGESITVTLKGTEGFKGFLLMALRANAEAAGPVGSFEAFDAADSSLVQDFCNGGVTHTADFSSLSPKREEIKLKWIAPDSSVGTFNFYATFVKQLDTFWVKVAAANPIQYEEDMEKELEMIDDSNCETTSSCFHNCEDGDCEDFIVKWTNDSSSIVTFELQGAVTADEGYVALGLSSDKQMIDVTIIACVADSGAPKVVTLFAASRAVPDANAGDVVDIAGASVSEHTSDDVVTFISCKFTYNNTMAKEMLNGSKWKDLGEVFYAFMARGMYKDGSVSKHSKHPIISMRSIQFLSNFKAPPPPKNLKSESLTPTSGRLSWSPLEYTDHNHPIQQYQVDCKVINNTYNSIAELSSTSNYNTSNSSTTSLTIQTLHSQVKYSCTVKALLANGGFGESSDVTVFWTRPEGNYENRCPSPPTVHNAEIFPVYKTWPINTSISYVCLDGFIKHGQSILKCGLIDSKAEWLHSPPTCESPGNKGWIIGLAVGLSLGVVIIIPLMIYVIWLRNRGTYYEA